MVRATQQDEQICVTVADTGPGIHPDHLPHLFDRFYRVNKARSHAIADDAVSNTDDISGGRT
jgi:histidine kinase